jgi:hypothetical protein
MWDAMNVSVPIELLEKVLAKMVSDWHEIDSEFGPFPGGLEAMVKRGDEPEIASLREVLSLVKVDSTESIKGDE